MRNDIVKTSVSKYLNEISIKSKNGEYEEALALCAALLTDLPDSYEIFETRSEVYYRMGDYENALSDLEQVIKLMPNEVAPLFRRGRWKLKHGDCYEAIKDLSMVIESGSNYFLDAAYYFRSLALLNCREYSKALSDIEHVPDDFFIGPNSISKSEIVRKATTAGKRQQ